MHISEQIKTGITAYSGGGQANAAELVAGVNVVSVVAAANDSVRLPAKCAPGTEVTVRTTAATNALAVYPPTGGTINNAAANAVFTVTAQKGAILRCVDTTGAGLTWIANLSA